MEILFIKEQAEEIDDKGVFSNGSILINNNPTHGFIADIAESFLDQKALMLSKFLPNRIAGVFATGSAKETRETILNISRARGGDLGINGHSQGTLLETAALLTLNKEEILELRKYVKSGKTTVTYNGTAVDSELAMKYWSTVGLNSKGKQPDFISTVNPNDMVGMGMLMGHNGVGQNNNKFNLFDYLDALLNIGDLSGGTYDKSKPLSEQSVSPHHGENYGCTGNRCGAEGEKKPGLGRVYSDGEITSLEDYQKIRGLKLRGEK